MSIKEKVGSVYRKIKEGFYYYSDHFDARMSLFPIKPV